MVYLTEQKLRMARSLHYGINERIVSRSQFTPVGKGITHHTAMDIQNPTCPEPFMGEGINNYTLESFMYSSINCLNEHFWSVRCFHGEYGEMSHVCIEVATAILCVNYGYLV